MFGTRISAPMPLPIGLFSRTGMPAIRPVPAGKDLFTHYLNHKHHLESPKMISRYKVVFNEGGQRVKAAVTRAGEIIEHTLVFVPVASEAEALYLAGILNSEQISHLFAGETGRGTPATSLCAARNPNPSVYPFRPHNWSTSGCHCHRCPRT